MTEGSKLISLAESLDPEGQDEVADYVLKHFVTDRGEIRIEGNDTGLKLFASQVLRLLARDYFAGQHQDFDVGAPSDEGSCRLTIVRTE